MWDEIVPTSFRRREHAQEFNALGTKLLLRQLVVTCFLLVEKMLFAPVELSRGFREKTVFVPGPMQKTMQLRAVLLRKL